MFFQIIFYKARQKIGQVVCDFFPAGKILGNSYEEKNL